jgi:DNA-binding transcriptional MerR regulator
MEGFTAEQASRLTNCTAHQLRYWDRVGLVKPSVQSTGGRPGVRRLYSFRDLVALRVIRSLLDSGLSLQRVRRAFDYLRKKADEHLSEVRLMTDGKSIFQVCRNEGEMIDALKEGQMAFALALDDVVRSVDGRRTRYLYDREELISTLRRVEGELKQELATASLERRRTAGAG